MPPHKKKKEEKEIAPVAPVVVAPTEDDDDDIEVVIRDEVDEKGKEKYYQSVGRRKQAIARVRLFTKKSTDNSKDDRAILTVNGKDYVDYFNDVNLLVRVEAPLRKLKSLNRFKATAIVSGGGLAGQADAIKHGLARALEVFDTNFRKKLKKAGFLSRDSRKKERRKYGLKKARKSPQWSKR